MLTSKQRAQLRALANTTDTILQIGKSGIGDNFITQVDDALEARELVKVKVLENAPASVKELAVATAEATHSDVVQVIGTRFVLYRESVHKKTILLVR